VLSKEFARLCGKDSIRYARKSLRSTKPRKCETAVFDCYTITEGITQGNSKSTSASALCQATILLALFWFRNKS
jgi:hypothetical protein